MRPVHRLIIGAAIMGAALSACDVGTKPPLVATDILVSESVPGKPMSAGYLTFQNNSSNNIRISQVTSPEFGLVELHESVLQDGVAKMRRIEELSIPANSTVTLQPGGKHLMLMRPSRTAKMVSLNFYDDETLLLSVQTSFARSNN